MSARRILETRRLVLQEFTIRDAGFVLELLNTPSWLEYIGDRNVHTLDDAIRHIETVYLQGYLEKGFDL